MDRFERAQAVHQRLLDHFGKPQWDKRDALDELILTVLSQNTNDRNRDLAYDAMRKRYTSWEEMMAADEAELIDTVRIAGLANQKAPRIQEILRIINDQEGSLNLAFLEKMPPEEVQSWLLSLKGVGLKTASIVMVFSLGMPAFPVDTHVYRVSGRIGLRDKDISVEKAHTALQGCYNPEQYGDAHLLLIYLGREICAARKPACPQCPVKDLCLYDNKTEED
jgi:endonuclease III